MDNPAETLALCSGGYCARNPYKMKYPAGIETKMEKGKSVLTLAVA
jgi:hypothetical protein